MLQRNSHRFSCNQSIFAFFTASCSHQQIICGLFTVSGQPRWLYLHFIMPVLRNLHSLLIGQRKMWRATSAINQKPSSCLLAENTRRSRAVSCSGQARRYLPATNKQHYLVNARQQDDHLSLCILVAAHQKEQEILPLSGKNQPIQDSITQGHHLLQSNCPRIQPPS